MTHANNHNDKPLSALEIIGSTIAAALGVQSSRNRKRDFERGNVLHFIAAGIIFTVVFVVAVLAIVHWTIGSAT